MNLSSQLNALEEKLTRLARKFEQLKTENEQLRLELAARDKKIENLRLNLQEAQESLEKNPAGLTVENPKEWIERLERYIQQVDACMEWLQNA